MRKVALLAALLLPAFMVSASPALAHSSAGGPAQEQVGARGGLDCNGYSPLQKTFRHLLCTEVASNSEYGFIDNGHYVGHDEPDLGFYSNTPGSGNSMSYQMVLPADPAGPASGTFAGPVHEFLLTGCVDRGFGIGRRPGPRRSLTSGKPSARLDFIPRKGSG